MTRSFGEISVRTSLVVIALGTATPVLALFGTAAISYYGVVSREPMVIALLQHRGVLQLALGLALVWAAFHRTARIGVSLCAAFTKASYLVLLVMRPETRALMPEFSTWFDGLAVLLLLALAIGEAQRRKTTVSTGATAVSA